MAILLRNVRKVYPGRGAAQPPKVAVHNVCLGVARGECFGLLGANGAGKTSVLSMLSGRALPSGGSVTLCGVPPSARGAQRSIGVVTQSNELFDFLSCLEAVLFVCRCKGVPERRARRVASELLLRAGLGTQLTKLAVNLSGGNKRKLALACALVGQPTLLLLDEPSSGMDPLARRTLWSVVRNAIADGRRAVVLSTHLMEEAERVCTRVAVLADGRFRCIGTPAHIKRAHGGGVVLEVQTRVARGELEGDGLERERAQRVRVCDLVAELLTEIDAGGGAGSADERAAAYGSARSRAEAALIEHHAGKYKFLLERADYDSISLAQLFETFEAARRAELLTSFSLELCSMEHVLIGLIDQSRSEGHGGSGESRRRIVAE